ncbi:MAG: hypothetical protein IJE04_02390 [Bacilli bacterium]|nr:hypothetical protein [Bacilli bacterium]
MDFNTRNFLKSKFIKIKDLYVNRKYATLIKECTDYLNIYPNETNVRFMRAKAYRYKGMFKEAIEDLNYNLSLGENAHSIVELYYIYYFLNMYEEALNLLPELYKNKYINVSSLAISEAIMKKQLGIPFKTKSNYVINQINDFNKKDSLNHIINNHQKEYIEGKSMFYRNVDINYLYDILIKNLKNSKKANIEEMLEIHYFGVSNIGTNNYNVCNFIKVVVIPNTNNIISIYPIDTVYNLEFVNLENDRSKLFKEDKYKIKTISRIDKFNNRNSKRNKL